MRFLNQERAAFSCVHLVSWNWFSSCVGMCMCLPPRPLITSGVIWCDIDCVQLVKQVLQLFPAFSYFTRHLSSIKWKAVSILTQHAVNTCQRKLWWHSTSYKRTTQKTECFIYKSKGRMCNDAFKSRLAFSFTVIISA